MSSDSTLITFDEFYNIIVDNTFALILSDNDDRMVTNFTRLYIDGDEVYFNVDEVNAVTFFKENNEMVKITESRDYNTVFNLTDTDGDMHKLMVIRPISIPIY